MTADLKKYVEGLLIQVYRMTDGSIVVAEECHRDNVDGYVVLRRPLQVCQVPDGNVLKSVFIPWIPGADDHVRVSLENVVAEMDASFDQKFSYSRYYLIEHLHKYLSPTEFEEIMSTQNAPKNPEKLKANLTKGKRFHLN